MFKPHAPRVSTALLALSYLAFSGCDVPPEDAPQTDVVQQALLGACSAICSASGFCSTGCSVTDSLGSYALTCGIFLNGSCDNHNPEWTMPKDTPPTPSGSGALYEPFYCAGPGPYEVVFWEHANYGGRCVTRKAAYSAGKYVDFFDRWIENPSGLNWFPNDKLSAVAVGTRVTLETFNNADFGQSFGTWAPNSWVPYVGNYANDKVSSYKIRVVK